MQEADFVRGIYGAHGGYETVEVCGVRRIGGGRGLRGGGRKRVYRVSPERPQSFRHQRRPAVDDCSPGRGGMAQDDGTRGGTFHKRKWINATQEKTRAGLRHAVVCVTVRNKERIAQSKRARAGSLAIQ